MSRAHSIVGFRPEGRPESDFYPTPPEAVKMLLNKFTFCEREAWEPACGDGAISKVLEGAGFAVHSSDLYDRGYGLAGMNFLETMTRPCNVLITNPPFIHAEKFLVHALNLGVRQIALLLKLPFLEGMQRSKVLESSPLQKVLVFRKRLSLYRDGEKMKNSGMIAFAWFVWDTDYIGTPEIGWLP